MQRLVYILVYPILWLISILPFPLLYVFSDFVYFLVYRVFGYRTKTVRENLVLVFPEKSTAEIKEIERKFYHHLCDMIVEAIKSITISESELKKRFISPNLNDVLHYEKEGKDVVLMLAHYASWEWFFILNRYTSFRCNAIYKKLKNKYFDNLVKRVRARYDTYLIPMKSAIPEITRARVNGEVTLNGFVSDQSPKWYAAHHWNTFMGIPVPVYTGAELIAKRLDMAVLFVKVKKVKRGFYEAYFETITDTPKEFPDYEITDIFLKKVEEQIYEAPEYFLWTHKRWKHRDRVPEDYKKKD